MNSVLCILMATFKRFFLTVINADCAYTVKTVVLICLFQNSTLPGVLYTVALVSIVSLDQVLYYWNAGHWRASLSEVHA